MNTRKLEFNLPAYWSSYLINADASGLREGEQATIDAFCDRHGIGGCAVDCGESFFRRRNDADNIGGDVCRFTFLVPVKPLDSFTRAYVITALWASTDGQGEPLDASYSMEDIAPVTLERIVSDCARFQSEQAQTISDAIATCEVVCGPGFDAYGRAGHDFWLTRNGHGAGFWDGDWPKPYGDVLTKAAKAFGSCDLYVGDDGKLYI